jgi:cytochrome c-type biogenesis protein CcmH
MNAILFASMLLMLLLALSFATAPLIHREKSASNGFVNVPLLTVLAALLLAVGLYAAIGRPDVASTERAQDASNPAVPRPSTNEGNKAASVNDLLEGLVQRLEDNPDDGKGWLLLAKSYDHVGRSEDAAAAYDKASALGVSDSDLEARLTQ